MRTALALLAALWAGAALAGVEGDRALGEHLASECVACHQLNGRAVGSVPPIVGVDAKSFVAMMDAYRRKERESDVMRMIAGRLSEEEIAALAVYFESVRPKP